MTKEIKTPPKFDGLNFFIWKVKMIIFLQSLGSRVAKAVTKPFSAPTGDESTWTEIETKDLMQMLGLTMHYSKHLMMMILLE